MTREPAHKQNYRNTTRELAGWLAGGITSREPVVHLAGWLAGQRLAAPERPREADRGHIQRTSLSCAWLEAPHKQIYDQGGSSQISLWNPRGSPRGDFIACCSCCFLWICLIAFLVRDTCEGAPTKPDSLWLQLEHVVFHWEAAFLKVPKSRKRLHKALCIHPFFCYFYIRLKS